MNKIENLLREDFKAGWYLNLYKGAYEATASFIPTLQTRDQSNFAGAIDKTRSQEEASKRAARRIRRYCVSNGLNRLGTLTYEGEGLHDQRQLRKDIAQFFGNLRNDLGKNFPYVWVPEWHKTHHGLHVHFAVGSYIQKSKIDNAWGRGFTHIKLITDLPAGFTKIEEARIAAGYISKYVAKSFEDTRRIERTHRYDIAQGFTPQKFVIYSETKIDAITKAIDEMGAEPSQYWDSNSDLSWGASPVVWMGWNGR